MAISGFPIYLSTLLLEKNRGNGKGPTLLVSDWAEPIAEAGFAGVEIWMNHLQLASRSEWGLIKERAQESDLAIAYIASTLPSDPSDKSRRLRDAILEACDYFHPDGIKFTPTGPKAEALGYVKDWSRDVPREITLLYDAAPGDSGVASLEAARKVLSGGRFKGVLHPFLMPAAELEAALASSGEFVLNLGVQSLQGTAWAALGESHAESLKVVAAAKKTGFKGTWTVEYTKGAGAPGENIERLFDQSEGDLNFLLEALATGTASTHRKERAPRRKPRVEDVSAPEPEAEDPSEPDFEQD